jgi:hypothetical protein
MEKALGISKVTPSITILRAWAFHLGFIRSRRRRLLLDYIPIAIVTKIVLHFAASQH